MAVGSTAADRGATCSRGCQFAALLCSGAAWSRSFRLAERLVRGAVRSRSSLLTQQLVRWGARLRRGVLAGKLAYEAAICRSCSSADLLAELRGRGAFLRRAVDHPNKLVRSAAGSRSGLLAEQRTRGAASTRSSLLASRAPCPDGDVPESQRARHAGRTVKLHTTRARRTEPGRARIGKRTPFSVPGRRSRNGEPGSKPSQTLSTTVLSLASMAFPSREATPVASLEGVVSFGARSRPRSCKDIGLSSDSLSLQHVAGSGGRSRQSGRAGVLRLLVEVPKVPVVSCFQFGRKTAPNARLA